MSKVVIVGGGVVGLFTAWYLQKAGAEVTVVERTDLNDGCSFGLFSYLEYISLYFMIFV